MLIYAIKMSTYRYITNSQDEVLHHLRQGREVRALDYSAQEPCYGRVVRLVNGLPEVGERLCWDEH